MGWDGGSDRVKKGLAKLCSTYIHIMCLQRYRILWLTLEQLERSLKWDFRPIWSSWAPNPKSSKVALSTNFCQDFLTSDWLEDLHFWLTLADFSQPWNPLMSWIEITHSDLAPLRHQMMFKGRDQYLLFKPQCGMKSLVLECWDFPRRGSATRRLALHHYVYSWRHSMYSIKKNLHEMNKTLTFHCILLWIPWSRARLWPLSIQSKHHINWGGVAKNNADTLV